MVLKVYIRNLILVNLSSSICFSSIRLCMNKSLFPSLISQFSTVVCTKNMLKEASILQAEHSFLSSFFISYNIRYSNDGLLHRGKKYISYLPPFLNLNSLAETEALGSLTGMQRQVQLQQSLLASSQRKYLLFIMMFSVPLSTHKVNSLRIHHSSQNTAKILIIVSSKDKNRLCILAEFKPEEFYLEMKALEIVRKHSENPTHRISQSVFS